MARKENKYGAIKTEVDGIKFDSRAEANRYKELKLMLAAGVIRNLKLQPGFTLQEGFRYKGKKMIAIKYKADFMYIEADSGLKVVEDVKGMQTPVFKIKHKLFLYKYGNEYDFRIVK